MKTKAHDNTKATAVIPYFKRALTIDRAVLSLIDIDQISEVLIVDDELSEASCVALNCIIANHQKIKVIPNLSTKGALSARIEGVKAASNDLVVFLDSDDEANSEGVIQCLEVLNSDPELSMVYGNICFGWNMQTSSDFIRISGYGYLQVLKNLSLCPFSGLCVRIDKIKWNSLRRDLPAWQDDEFVLTTARYGMIQFVNCITAIMHDSGSGRISDNKRSQLIGLETLLEKWKIEIVHNFGYSYFLAWKLRKLSILIRITSANIERKGESSNSRMKASVLRLYSFLLRIAQRLLGYIFGFFFDRVYA